MKTSVLRSVAIAALLAASHASAVEFERSDSLFAHDPPSQQDHRFGLNVAADGTTVAIAATRAQPNFLDVVYIYVRRGTQWQRQAALTNPGRSGRFGYSLALQGDVLVVGAPSSAGAEDSGEAHIYRRQGETWTRVGLLRGAARADADAFGDAFGYSVAVNDGRVLVGAPGKDSPGLENHGALYVFEATGSAWFERARLQANDARADDFLGASVAWSGTTALGGAIGADIGAANGQGAVYAFVGGAQTQKLVAANGEAGDGFGIALAADASTLVAGAYSDDVDGRINQGSARVFARQGDAFVETQVLIDPQGSAGAVLGYTVGLSGDNVVLGASAPRVFRREGGTWRLLPSPEASDTVLASATAGDFVVLGAPGTDVGNSRDRGTVTIAALHGNLWREEALLTSDDVVVGTTFGFAADVDRDVAIVGGPALCTGFCPPTLMPGAAYLFRRDTAGRFAHERTLIGEPPRYGDGFAHAVAIDGERALVASGGGFDWDYQPELVIQERRDGRWQRAAVLRDAAGAGVVADYVAIDGDVAMAGNPFAVYLFHRSAPDHWELEAQLPAGLRESHYLTGIALDGDTAALGIADFTIGAVHQGAVYILQRSGGRWDLHARLTGDAVANKRFGGQVALHGDTLLVGESGDAQLGVAGGAVVFERVAGQWQRRARLDLPNASREGAGIALHDSLALVLVRQGNRNGVFAFERNGGWRAAGKLSTSAGPRLAFDGETLLMGVVADDLDQTREVAVYRVRR